MPLTDQGAHWLTPNVMDPLCTFLCLTDAKRFRIDKEVHSVRQTDKMLGKNKTMVDNTEKIKREEMQAGGW